MTFVAITCILLVAMFIYFRQRIMACEDRLSLLSDTIQTMAGITMSKLTKDSGKSDENSDSDDSESDESDESEDEPDNESTTEIESVKSVTSDSKNKSPTDLVNELVCELCDVFDKNTVSDDEIVVKKIEVDLYNSLTLKELKEKVSGLNGPKLRTKKEMIDFLKGTEDDSNKNLTPEV